MFNSRLEIRLRGSLEEGTTEIECRLRHPLLTVNTGGEKDPEGWVRNAILPRKAYLSLFLLYRSGLSTDGTD